MWIAAHTVGFRKSSEVCVQLRVHGVERSVYISDAGNPVGIWVSRISVKAGWCVYEQD